jgi:SAM-dependent methyltransferase
MTGAEGPVAVFVPAVAASYDAVYAHKDYGGEAVHTASLIRRYRPTARRVLDLGCGTGRHARHLAELGFEVVGVDRSPSMLAVARERCGIHVRLHRADVASLELPAEFDAVVLLFNVLGYAAADAGLERVLEAARRHMAPGGVLVADGWWAPAVLRDRPRETWRVVPVAGGHVLRLSRGRVAEDGRNCVVDLELWDVPDEGPPRRSTEQHVLRIFDGPELFAAVRQAGFVLEDLAAPGGTGTAPTGAGWNFQLVASAHGPLP